MIIAQAARHGGDTNATAGVTPLESKAVSASQEAVSCARLPHGPAGVVMAVKKPETLYGHLEQGVESEHYLKHVMAMTAEGLHSKAKIAAELAYRDAKIEGLESALAAAAALDDGHASEG